MARNRLVLLLSALAVISACGPKSKQLTVNVPALNMFSKADSKSDVVSQARFGQTVEVIGRKEGWRKIRTPDDYAGWVHKDSLYALPVGATYPAAGKQSVMVESLAAHLYPVASLTKRAPLMTVPFESVLEVVRELPGQDGRWIEIRLPDKSTAFVQRGDVSFDPKTRSIPELIELSKRFLGRPYTWGGTTAIGFDCSGFTQMLCRRGGVDIPRDARPQALWAGMKPVDKKDLQPGDLLYFGPSMEKIGHTGFYLGNGEFIHSTASGHPGVQISNLNDEKWTQAFVCARRWNQQ